MNKQARNKEIGEFKKNIFPDLNFKSSIQCKNKEDTLVLSILIIIQPSDRSGRSGRKKLKRTKCPRSTLVCHVHFITVTNLKILQATRKFMLTLTKKRRHITSWGHFFLHCFKEILLIKSNP